MAINFTGSYSENFDSLANTGTSSTLPEGWVFIETGTNANTTYTAGTGSSNTGDTYSFGSTGSTDRAVGGVLSGGLTPLFGSSFTNTTANPITTLTLSYTGEQWRLGTTGRAEADRLDFQYSLDATSLTAGTWVDVNALDFNAPVTTGTVGALNGNTNNTTVTATISGLNIPVGATFWFRWQDFNAAGSDDGLAIDNFSLSAGGGSAATLSLAASPNAFSEGAGATAATGTVTRTGDLTNPLVVTLSSNDTSEATVPTSVTLAAGQASATFAIAAIDDTTVDGSQPVILTASATGFSNATTALTVTDDDTSTGTTRIHDIQGAAHLSPLNGQGVVNVPGIVTAIASNGFYIQDPTPDSNDATSEAVFVFTTNAAILSARTVGEAVLVSGTVTEFRPGGNSNNLTITEITNNSSVQSLNVTPWTNAPTTAIAPTVLGNGGRAIPTAVIENDATNVESSGTFDPAEDGIDFYESLEGMLVQINNPVTTSPTANFGSSEEIWVLADNGANATSRTARGGSLITSSDSNPERIQIDDLNNSALTLPAVNVGAQLSSITGVVNYDFSNYEVLVSTAPTVVQPSPLQKEVTNLTASPNQLTVATFNVENLDPGDGATKFNALASAIVNNLKSPDIINVEEVQDNNGPTNDSVVDASTTFQTLINAIAAAGGPTYEYRQINPVDDTNGGEPGGNIRVGFLYNPGRVTFVDRPGGTSTSSTTVTDVGNNGTPDLSASPGLIDPTNSAFSSSRKPLVGEFSFNGQTVYVIGNHFNSKGGDQPLFGPNQPPTLNSEVQRTQQATIVKNFVQSILAIDPNANIVVAGDLNDFEFSNPLNLLKSGGLNDLVETLPANERYTYNFQGNAQTLDHILTSNNLLSKLDGFDVVHINSEFADQVSDHDPGVARFNLATLNQAPTAVNFTGATTDLAENTSTATRIKVADIAITDDAQGTNVLSLSGTDANFFEIDSSVLYLKANTALNFEAKSSYAVTVNVDDATVGSTPDASNTLTLAITNVNEAPIANNDSGFTANQSTAKQIPVAALLANDTDPDANTTLSITPNGFSDAVGGSVALNGSNVVFTPDSSFSGTASFKYTVSDGSLTSQATVTLEVGKTINAGNGKDTITGTAGDDILIGGNGKDILIGGAGDDTLMGGNGKDVFVLVGKGNGTDTIQDFTPKQDQIGLSGGLSFGQLSFADVNGSAAIRLGNETLALLTGVNSNQLTPADFVTV